MASKLLLPGAVLVVGAAGAAAYWYFMPSAEAAVAPPVPASPPPGLYPSGVPGVWLANSGIVLTQVMVDFLSQIRPMLPFDLTVTSGLRTPAKQASLMLDGSVGTGSAASDILAVYKSSAGREAAAVAPQGVAALTQLLEQQVARGVYVSRHMSGNAIDFRNPPGPGQRDMLAEAGRALGVTVVTKEGNSEDHVHMEDLDSATAMVYQTVQSAKKHAPLIGIATAAGIGLVLITVAATWPEKRGVT